MPFSKNPDSYPAEYLELFRRGYEGPFTLTLPDRGTATSLRHRLHAYRRALSLSASPFYQLTASCEVKVEDNILTVQPKAHEIRAALAASGVSFDTSSLPESLLAEEQEAEDALERALRAQNYGKAPPQG
jgi:hypothetical protein